ncbi:MAG TPA: YhdP family protein [Gammaproteobacteria bacterium]|nr:YhdP family protein [Gammaproteobacteria bacterium]
MIGVCKRVLLHSLHVLWLTFATLTLALAVAVSVARLWLNDLDSHRHEAAEWLGQQVRQPVDFDHIRVDWHRWVPVVELTNVRVMDEAREHILTRFEKARLTVDVLKSIQRKEFIPGHLTVSGLHLSLSRGEDDSIHIEGISPQRAGTSSLQQNALAYWLQTQHRLTIESAAITWQDQRALLKPVVFANVTLKIRSDGQRRQLEGTARLPDQPAARFRFLLDAEGDLLTTAWSGRLYLEAKHLEPSFLLEYRRWLGLEMHGGELDFEMWSDWKKARLTDVDGRFDLTDAGVGTAANQLQVRRAAGRLLASRQSDEEWVIALSKLNLATSNGAWPETGVGLRLITVAGQETPAIILKTSFLRLHDLLPTIADLNALPEALRDVLKQFQPAADLRDLTLGYFPQRTGSGRFSLQTGFSALGTTNPAAPFGAESLAGRLTMNAEEGVLNLDSRHLVLHAPQKQYAQPLSLQQLRGEVRWRLEDGEWHFQSDGLNLAVAAFVASLSGDVTWSPGHSPMLNVRAGIAGGPVDRVCDYLPGTLSTGVRTWFQRALRGGRISEGLVVWRGALDRFPYDEHDGIFQAQLHVIDGHLRYSESWPEIEQATADILFSGRSLSVQLQSGRMLNVAMQPTEAHIDDLDAERPEVMVAGMLKASADQGRDYLMHSPLQSRVNKDLQSLSLTGNLALELQLQIPLHEAKEVEFQGQLHLDKATLGAPALNGEITGAQGIIAFTHDHFSTSNLSGKYLDQPVQVSASGDVDNGRLTATFDLSGRADKDFFRERAQQRVPELARWFEDYGLFDRMEGGTDWTLHLALSGQDQIYTAHTLEFKSSLQGMALHLPPPLGKEADVALPLSVQVDLAAPVERTAHFTLADRVRGELTLENKPSAPPVLKQLRMQLGGRDVTPPADGGGIWIGGQIDTLALSQWMDWLHGGQPDGAAVTSSAPPLPVVVDVDADHVEVLGRWFDQLHLEGGSGANQWLFTLRGEQVEGDAAFPYNMTTGTATVTLKRLHVPPRGAETSTSMTIHPAHIPAVTARCEDLRFESINLGHAELHTRATADGLHLETMVFDSPAAHIIADGDWRDTQDVQTSQLHIQVDAHELAKLMTMFGYDVTNVEKGKTHIDINATWGGSPAAFTLEKLNGSLTLSVKEGRFLDINPATTGRLFGLLSLQTLPRRLLLDFNDLFRSGMGFDQINGTFELDQGNAYTNNLMLESPSAHILITGRTGLADKDYDQVAIVTPQLTDTFPVASALLGPAGAGVGAALFVGKKLFKGLPEQIDSLLSKQYTITGSWERPTVEQTSGFGAWTHSDKG